MGTRGQVVWLSDTELFSTLQLIPHQLQNAVIASSWRGDFALKQVQDEHQALVVVIGGRFAQRSRNLPPWEHDMGTQRQVSQEAPFFLFMQHCACIFP